MWLKPWYTGRCSKQNWDIPPGRPLSLGCVPSSTKRPLPPLLISPLTGVPSATTPSTTDDQLQQPIIYPTTKHNVSYKTSTYHSGSVAKLQGLVEQSPVSRYLDRLQAWSPKCVLVVTGVKVAYGARVESRDAREVKGDLSVLLDPGVAGGVPGVVEFGPGLGLRRKRSAEVGSEIGVDGHEDPGFVFAYQVQRVKVKKRNAEVIDVVSKACTHGAVYGSGHVANEPGGGQDHPHLMKSLLLWARKRACKSETGEHFMVRTNLWPSDLRHMDLGKCDP